MGLSCHLILALRYHARRALLGVHVRNGMIYQHFAVGAQTCAELMEADLEDEWFTWYRSLGLFNSLAAAGLIGIS